MTDTRPAFGIPWAAEGETRPARFRTPMAWADGAGEGCVLVQDGPSDINRRWLTMAEWRAWIAEAKAKPSEHEPEPDDQPWPDDKH